MSASGEELWFPELCRLPRLVAMMGLGLLVVIVLALAPQGGQQLDLQRFMSAGGYAMWLALMVSGSLCVLRPRLSALSVRVGSLAALAFSALIASGVAAIVHALLSSGEATDGLPALGRFVSGTAGVVVLLTASALRYFYVLDRWQAQIAAHARAEADALQARIRPHFLFNSMNMIASLLRRDPALAEQAVLDLSDLFRAALGAGENDSTLEQEVFLAERYLAVEQLRLGERLDVDWHLDPSLPWAMPMPRLVLQPLLENAVMHGISRMSEGGTVEVAIRHAEETLRIDLCNPAPAPSVNPMHGAGYAVKSIIHRLQFRYGPGAGLVFGWSDGFYRCQMRIPVTRDVPITSSRSVV